MRALRLHGWILLALFSVSSSLAVECPCWSVDELLELPPPRADRADRCVNRPEDSSLGLSYFEPPPPPGGGRADRKYSLDAFIDGQDQHLVCIFTSFCRDEICEQVSRLRDCTLEQFEVCKMELAVVGHELGYTCFESEDE